MGYVATFDAGTTAVKAALTDDDGIIIASCSSGAMPLFTGDGHREQDPFDWWRAFLQAAHAMLTQASQSVPKFDPADILGIIMSGQMQDVIALDGQLNPVRRAMLYSDGRADREAGELAEIVGDTTFHNLTGNQLEGSLPLPKLMWFKRHEPQNFAKTRHVLFDAKDYLVARLTGALSADVVASSTVGAMDICRHVWSSRLIDAAGMDELLFPALRNPEDRVGEIAGRAAETTGFALGTPVFAGIGDAGATTLASGVTKPGEYNINIGTSGWIAAISPEPITDQIGVANLACTTVGAHNGVSVGGGRNSDSRAGGKSDGSGANKRAGGNDTVKAAEGGVISDVSSGDGEGAGGGVISGVPFLNAGNVHRWITSVFAGNRICEGIDCEDASCEGTDCGKTDCGKTDCGSTACGSTACEATACEATVNEGRGGRSSYVAHGKGRDDRANANPRPSTSHSLSASVSRADYSLMGAMLARSRPGSNGVLCLPYLSGERFPVMNASIRGAYVGLSSDTTAADMARAALEGVAFSIRQGLEIFDAEPSEITLIGGGAREPVWCQIMADVLGHPIEVFRNADVMPAAALSFLVQYALGRFESLDEVTERLRACRDSVTYEPHMETVRLYDEVYSRYRSLYPAIDGLG